MKYEKLSNGNNSKKVFLCGLIVGVALIIVINFFMSYAKYKVVDSVKLAEGTVNYTRADFSLIGIKVQEKNEDGSGKEIEGGLGKDYKDAAQIPEDGDYEFNAENTYCTIGSDLIHYTGTSQLQEQGISITYGSGPGLVFSGIKKTNTKCYVYFDVSEKEASEKTLADLDLHSQGDNVDFSGTACLTGCDKKENGVYQADDDYGISYYFRGTVDNNWVKFGKTTEDKDIYWRIIRINGNGSIRLIYAGDSDSLEKNPNGKNVVDNKAYNSSYNDNKYVGFMYGGTKGAEIGTSSYEEAHKNETPSDVLGALYDWWNNSTNLDTLLGKIDGSTGFCNDRQSYNGGSSFSQPDIIDHGYGKVVTSYGPFIRVRVTHQPTFLCVQKSQDLFTLNTDSGEGNGALIKPVGLITSDEVMYAGGYDGTNNTRYWLYTNQDYWTMSSWGMDSYGYATVFIVNTTGSFGCPNVNNGHGVRPVINLKVNTKFTTANEEDKGTATNPYIVQ